MSSIIIYDFEVFKYDTLLGAIEISEKGQEIFQSWDLNEIKNYFYEHEQDMWIGHNNLGYDNHILEACVNDVNPYLKSKSIINARFRPKCNLDFTSFDLMQGFWSLKMSELARGIDISESEVDFNLDRPLTDEEKRLTESYNRDDLEQTLFNFNDLKSNFSLRVDICKEFGLNPKVSLNATEAKLASTVLKAKPIFGIENMLVKPKIYDTLRIQNQDVIDFYLNEDFRNGKNMTATFCGCEHKLGAGGIHAALKKVHYDKAMYFDVSGYYNLIMLNYDLLPRTVPQEGRELYEYMYHEQLRLKKIDPQKRWVYKTILLAVFGAMMNKYTDFYDPQRGSLVTMVGQIFLVDLLEKLEGKGFVVQSNTDGIMFIPFDWNNEEAIWDIVREWENRTGFVIKKEHVYNIWQRDVNNYCYTHEPDIMQYKNEPFEKRLKHISVKGEAVGSFDQPIEMSTAFMMWDMKEPKIICQGIVDKLMFDIEPEDTVNAFKHDLRYFQHPCKKLSFDYVTYEWKDLKTGEQHVDRLQNVNRAFALKSNDIRGMVMKYKTTEDGKTKKTKVSNLSDNVFVYNDEILSKETTEKLSSKIDWQYYIDRICERIREFVPMEYVGDLHEVK